MPKHLHHTTLKFCAPVHKTPAPPSSLQFNQFPHFFPQMFTTHHSSTFWDFPLFSSQLTLPQWSFILFPPTLLFFPLIFFYLVTRSSNKDDDNIITSCIIKSFRHSQARPSNKLILFPNVAKTSTRINQNRAFHTVLSWAELTENIFFSIHSCRDNGMSDKEFSWKNFSDQGLKELQ